jgi:hypothetical protein
MFMDEEYMQDFSNKYAMQQVSSSPYAGNINQVSNGILLLTNPNDDLFELELKLRGCGEDSNGKIVQIVPALVNEVGVYEIIGCAKTIISQVTIMSNVENKLIDIHREDFADSLIILLMINRIRFNIVHPESTRTLIFTWILHKSIFCMYRAKEQGERIFLTKSQQEITMRNENKQGNQSGGMVSKVMGWANK